MTATLGGIIKDYRIRKRLSQLDLSLRIGWKDSSRLSKIEQGRVERPSRQTADKINSALELTEQEKGDFLLSGGYLPTDPEIKHVINIVDKKIKLWPYPAYLMDFSWRILSINQPAIDVFGFPQKLLDNVHKININLLDYLITPKEIEILKGDDKDTLKPLDQTMIAQFKAEHLGKENERWYKEIITRLVKNDEFRHLWNSVTANNYHKKLYEYEYKMVKYPKTNKILRYHVFDSKLVFDKRFSVTLYLEDSHT